MIVAFYNRHYDRVLPYFAGAATCMVAMIALLTALGWVAPVSKRQDRLPITIDERYIVDRDTCEIISMRGPIQ